jgi:hypothetical protein
MIKMKRNKLNIALILILACGSWSCSEDLLETVPNDRISLEIFWRTPNDALLALNSLYNDLEGVNLLSFDALTDIAHTNEPFDVQAYIEQGSYDALNNKIYNTWANAYKGIAAANTFLENVDKIAFSDEALLNRYKAEARVLRAYQYIRLVPLFGDVPLVKQTLTREEARKLTREKASAVWEFVGKELEEAGKVLPYADEYDAKDKGRISKGAALGLKARAALYAGDYRQAADAANQVIASKRHSLYPYYEKLFRYEAENNPEVLLDKQFVKDIYSNNVFYLIGPYTQKNANSYYVPTKALIDLYQTADGKDPVPANGYDAAQPYVNRDPRLHFSVFLDGDVLPNGIVFRPAPNSGSNDAIGKSYHNSTTGFNIKKYFNPEDYVDINNSGINIILLRYAEVLLTYAEAKIELNEIDGTVYDAINLVRNGREDVKLNSIPTGKLQQELREIVRRERAVELALEGFRLIDIRRWRIAENVLPGKIYGITYTGDDAQVHVYELAVTRAFNPQRDYLWPIPQKERDLNPNLSQNPNWGE